MILHNKSPTSDVKEQPIHHTPSPSPTCHLIPSISYCEDYKRQLQGNVSIRNLIESADARFPNLTGNRLYNLGATEGNNRTSKECHWAQLREKSHHCYPTLQLISWLKVSTYQSDIEGYPKLNCFKKVIERNWNSVRAITGSKCRKDVVCVLEGATKIILVVLFRIPLLNTKLSWTLRDPAQRYLFQYRSTVTLRNWSGKYDSIKGKNVT